MARQRYRKPKTEEVENIDDITNAPTSTSTDPTYTFEPITEDSGTTDRIIDEEVKGKAPTRMPPKTYEQSWPNFIQGLITGETKIKITRFLMFIILAYSVLAGWILIQDNSQGKLDTIEGLEVYYSKLIPPLYGIGIIFIAILLVYGFENIVSHFKNHEKG